MSTGVQIRLGWRARVGEAELSRRVRGFVRDHPVLSIFLLALAIRVVVSVGIAIFHPGNIAPDGIEYSRLAADKATGNTAYWDPYLHELYNTVRTLLVPLTGLYELFGVHQLIGQMYVALMGAGTAAITARLAMEILPRRWAFATGLIVALLPSQIVWSSLVLKDPAVWIVMSGLALTLAVAGRVKAWRLIGLGLVAAGLLVLLGYLRYQTLVVACWALMLGAVAGALGQHRVAAFWRIARVVGALALGVLVPWQVFGLGPAGLTYVKSSPAPSTIRAAQAQNAHTPISGALPSKPKPSSTRTPSSPVIPGATSETSADIHHLPQGLLAMLAEPYPWQSGGSLYLNLARVQALVWYPLLLLALLGLVGLRPRHLRVMAFPLLAGGATLILYALTEGNLGTAFRHRGEFEWVVALLAGIGLAQLAARRARARDRDVPVALAAPNGKGEVAVPDHPPEVPAREPVAPGSVGREREE